MHGYTRTQTPRSVCREKKKKKNLNSPETIALTNALTRIVVQYIALTNPPNYINEIAFVLR